MDAPRFYAVFDPFSERNVFSPLSILGKDMVSDILESYFIVFSTQVSHKKPINLVVLNPINLGDSKKTY